MSPDRGWLDVRAPGGRGFGGFALRTEPEHVRDALGIGRVVVIGQAPSRKGEATLPVTGAIGHRLAALVGWRLGLAFLQLVDRANLVESFPGYGGGRDAFPMRRARAAARELAPSLHGRVVIALGRGVCTAFGLAELPALERGVAYFDGSMFDLVHVPHPSGRNRWWNLEENRARARAVVQRVFWEGPARARLGPALPIA